METYTSVESWRMGGKLRQGCWPHTRQDTTTLADGTLDDDDRCEATCDNAPPLFGHQLQKAGMCRLFQSMMADCILCHQWSQRCAAVVCCNALCDAVNGEACNRLFNSDIQPTSEEEDVDKPTTHDDHDDVRQRRIGFV